MQLNELSPNNFDTCLTDRSVTTLYLILYFFMFIFVLVLQFFEVPQQASVGHLLTLVCAPENNDIRCNCCESSSKSKNQSTIAIVKQYSYILTIQDRATDSNSFWISGAQCTNSCSQNL